MGPRAAPIYMDNAATSRPKPAEVYEALDRFARDCGVSYGRSAHRLSVEASRMVFNARASLARLLKAADPSRVIFTANATDAINVALFGFLNSQFAVRDSEFPVVLRSAAEHNAVARPLHRLAKLGRIELREVACDSAGVLDLDSLMKQLPGARLLCLVHGSNVSGAIQPVAEAARLCRGHGARILVDAAQTAGVLPIDAEGWGIDMLAVTGHKSLLGPTGTGALILGPGVDLEPARFGGTGSSSDSLDQPENLPDKLESGTHNTFGLAGLAAAIAWIEAEGVQAIREREAGLMERLLQALRGIKGMKVYGPAHPEDRISVASVTFDHVLPSEAAFLLERRHDIMVRAGLHCAPLAHRCLGTFPQGTVRIAPGPFTTVEEIDAVIAAISDVAAGRV